MKDLDDKIRSALRNEDAELFDEFSEEPSIFELVIETFRGRHRVLVYLTVFWTAVFFILAIISAVKFFNAAEDRAMLMWAAATIVCMSAISLMKVWFWMEMNKNAITREVKRLELQIARLAGRIKDQANDSVA